MTEKFEMTEFEEVEIIPASTGITYGFQPAVINADFTSAKDKLRELIEPYDGLTADVVASMNMKDAKKCRSELKKIQKELNDARIAFQKVYNQPFEEFKAQVDELINMAKEPWALLDAGIKEAEENAKRERYETLMQTYEDFCPLLVPLVPFDRLLDNSWLNASTSEKKAEEELCAKAAELAKDWEILKGTELSCPQETEAEFFRTLSLSDALAFDKARFEELERIRMMNEEREALKALKPAPVTNDETLHSFTIQIPEIIASMPIDAMSSIVKHLWQFDIPFELTYSLAVPRSEFVTTIDEATALKNHLTLANIPVRMTIRNSEVCHA